MLRTVLGFGMSRRGPVVVGIVLSAWLAPRVVHAQATETIEGGARITKVEGKRITIDHGAKAGITVGTAGEVFPLRVHEGVSAPAIDLHVRLAIGRVTEVTDGTATLEIDSLAGAVDHHAFLSYQLTAPTDLAASPLFRVFARGVELISQVDDKPFATVESLLGDRSRTASDKALDAMVAELKSLRKVVVDVFTKAPTSGLYRGKSAGAIVDGLDRAQMTAFIEFVDAFALTYLDQRWKVTDAFFK